MTREELDKLWQQALRQSIKDGEQFTRYHFAALVAEAATEEANRRANASWSHMCEKMVAAEREACAKVGDEYSAIGKVEEFDRGWLACAKAMAAAIRARGDSK